MAVRLVPEGVLVVNMVKKRGYIDIDLVAQIKERHPELEALKPTGVVDWALRKLLKEEAETG